MPSDGSAAWPRPVPAWPNQGRRDALAEARQQMIATVGGTLDLPEVASRVLAVIVTYIPCDGATLLLRHGDVMRIRAVYGLPTECIGRDLTLAGPLLDQMTATRAPLWLADAEADDRFLPMPHVKEVRGWLAAPIIVGERILGQVALDSKDAGHFGEEQARLLDALVRQGALALENAQLYDEATRRLQQMALLNDLSTAMVSTPDVDEMVQRVVQGLRRSLGHETINLQLASEAGDVVGRRRPEEEAEEQRPEAAARQWGEGLAGWVAAVGRPIRMDDVRDYPGYVASSPEVRSELCVPIRAGDRVIGVIEMQSHRVGAFSDDDVHLLSIVAGQLARALENARLYAAERRRTEETLALLDIAENITSSLNLPDILKAGAHRTAQVCQVDMCLVMMVTEDGKHLQLAGRAMLSEAGPPPAWNTLIDVLRKYPLTEFPTTMQALTTGQAQVIAVDRVMGPFTGFLGATAGLNLILLVPLRISDRPVGMMILGNHDPGREFDAHQVSLAAAVGRQLAVAVENARLYARSRQTVRELSESLEQLRQAQAQLIQSAKLAAVGQLAAGVAHEINNPLTTIAGFSELILRDLPDDGTVSFRDDLALILHEAQRARDVVRRLLDFARQSESHRDLTNLNQAVRDTVVLIRHAAASGGVTLEEQYAPELPWVMLDLNQFKQVVLNLLNNAVQAIPHRGKLTVATGLEAREGQPGVWLKVTDTGVGIPPENLERIFEPFFTTKPEGEGTGLGLAVTYGIVRDHGGTIEVQSTVDQGTTFTVWMPAQEAGPPTPPGSEVGAVGVRAGHGGGEP